MKSFVSVAFLLYSIGDHGNWQDSLLSRLREGTGPTTSSKLLAEVQAVATAEDQILTPALAHEIVSAWKEGRQAPAVTAGDLLAIFEGKRDAIRKFDVIYQVKTMNSKTYAEPASADVWWWTRWQQEEGEASRTVASTREGLENEVADVTSLRWRQQNGRIWFRRIGEDEIALPELDATMIGIEDSWLGAGSCIGDSARGFARALEHDLAALLKELPSSGAVVESLPYRVDGAECVVLRVGWPKPYWFYLDPALGFAPRRVDRVLDVAGEAILSRTEMSGFSLCGGLWLPTQYRWTQHPIREQAFDLGSEPHEDADWTLEAKAMAIAVNGESCQCPDAES